MDTSTITPNPSFTLWLTLGVVPSAGLNICVTTRIHLHGFIPSIFPALKILRSSPVRPSLPLSEPLIFLLSL